MPIDAAPARLAEDRDIEDCYRLLLGREPDPAGFAAWREAVQAKRITVRQLVRSFADSFEFSGRGLKTVIQYDRPFLMPAGENMYPDDGRYEPYVYGPLMEILRPGVTFLDVGANIGLFSVLGAVKGARVISVEPQPLNARLILANAKANGVELQLHPVAVADKAGYALMPAGDSTSNATISDYLDPLHAQVVPLARLDTLVDEHVDVLKIDVEGFEHKALLGGRNILEKSRPVIVTEYSPEFQRHGGSTGEAYLSYLLSFGYSITVLHRDHPPERVRDAAETDRLWRAAMDQGITHLDLMLTV